MFAVFDPDKGVVDIANSLGEAVEEAESRGGPAIVDPAVEALAAPRQNPVTASSKSYKKAPTLALQECGLPRLSKSEVMGISLTEAAQVIAGLLPAEKYQSGLWKDGKLKRAFKSKKGAERNKEIESLMKQGWKRETKAVPLQQVVEARAGKATAARKLASSLFGGNLKLDKSVTLDLLDRVPVEAAEMFDEALWEEAIRDGVESTGLSLAPYWSGFVEGYDPPIHLRSRGKEAKKNLGKEFAITLRGRKVIPNFCFGSTAECRAGCLVGTGQNVAADYPGQPVEERHIYRIKGARTRALFAAPAHFARLMVEGTKIFIGKQRKAGRLASMRLNVYQDLPWELIFNDHEKDVKNSDGRRSWFFEMFQSDDVFFYDYTKVPGRRPPQNYDLTFSFAGTPASEQLTGVELERGMRAAVVFLTKKDRKTGVVPLPAMMPFSSGAVAPVISGDYYDMRWLDPGGVVVGLYYKTPTTRAGDRPTARDLGHFVVPVLDIGGELAVPHTPRQTDGDDYEEAPAEAYEAGDYR